MGPTRCPETSVNNCHTAMRNIEEERRYEAKYFLVNFIFQKLQTLDCLTELQYFIAGYRGPIMSVQV
jgi:hypothetical protein